MYADILTGEPTKPIYLDHLVKAKFFEFTVLPAVDGLTVKLSVSPLVDRLRGGLKERLETHLIGKCLGARSFNQVERNGFYWGISFDWTFHVHDQCPSGTYHLCEVTTERFESILNMSLNVPEQRKSIE